MSPTISAILAPSPFASNKESLNAKVPSADVIICSKAAACLKSTTSIISAILPPSATNCFIAGTSSSKPLIVFPNLIDNSEVGSCILRSIFLKEVPAIEASIPESDSFAIIAAVSSIEKPADFAIGATLVIPVCHFSISKAELLKDTAITSTTLVVSAASKPKPLIAAPETCAALAKSVPVAVAKSRVAFCASKISFAVKPNLEYANCSCPTCSAVKKVVLPSSSAESVNLLNSKSVAPDTACTLAITNSNSVKVLTTEEMALLTTLKAVTKTPIAAAPFINCLAIPLLAFVRIFALPVD